MIDAEVRRMVADCYAEAKNILVENREKLDKLASLLIEHEVMFREDVENIFGPRPFDEVPQAEELKETENHAD